VVRAEQALPAHLLEQFMRREDAGLFPLLGVRVDLGFDEFRDRAHQLAMGVGVEHAFPVPAVRNFLRDCSTIFHCPAFTKHLLGKAPRAC